MNNNPGQFLLTITIILALIAIFGPLLFSVINERKPKKKKRRRAIPTFSDGGEGEEVDLADLFGR